MRHMPAVLSAFLIALSPVTLGVMAQSAVAQSRVMEREVVRYTVRTGDTLSSIARSVGITLAELRSLNPNVDPRFPRVGQTIYLPADAPISRASLTLDQYRGRHDDEVALRGTGFRPGARLQIMAGESPYRMQVIDGARADGRGRVDVARVWNARPCAAMMVGPIRSAAICVIFVPATAFTSKVALPNFRRVSRELPSKCAGFLGSTRPPWAFAFEHGWPGRTLPFAG